VEAAPWWERVANTTKLCRSGRNPAKTGVFGTMLIEGKKGIKCPRRYFGRSPAAANSRTNRSEAGGGMLRAPSICPAYVAFVPQDAVAVSIDFALRILLPGLALPAWLTMLTWAQDKPEPEVAAPVVGLLSATKSRSAVPCFIPKRATS